MYQLPIVSSLSFVTVIITVFCRKVQSSSMSVRISKVSSIALVSREEATNQTENPLRSTSTKKWS